MLTIGSDAARTQLMHLTTSQVLLTITAMASHFTAARSR